MLTQVRAAVPRLLDLAHASKYASAGIDNAHTDLQKKAFLVDLDGVNNQLVKEVMKLGSSVLKSLEAAAAQEELSKDTEGSTPDEEKQASMRMRDALMLGGGIAAIPALAANYTLGKASDDIDAKMLAIPGLAAATVGAILAARNATQPSNPLRQGIAEELEGAISAKEVLDSASQKPSDRAVAADLAKLSSVNTDHIAQLVSEVLT